MNQDQDDTRTMEAQQPGVTTGPPDLQAPDFPVALRGYDRLAVDAYVDEVRRTLRRMAVPSSPDDAVRHALEEVGEQTGRVLREAADTASGIRNRAQEEADHRLAEADRRAAELVEGAERRLRELDVDTDAIWSERTRLVEDARRLGRQLIELADSAQERFPAADPPAEPEVPDPEAPESG